VTKTTQEEATTKPLAQTPAAAGEPPEEEEKPPEEEEEPTYPDRELSSDEPEFPTDVETEERGVDIMKNIEGSEVLITGSDDAHVIFVEGSDKTRGCIGSNGVVRLGGLSVEAVYLEENSRSSSLEEEEVEKMSEAIVHGAFRRTTKDSRQNWVFDPGIPISSMSSGQRLLSITMRTRGRVLYKWRRLMQEIFSILLV
jgi:hypothetical protein